MEHVIGEKSRETLLIFHFDEFFPYRSYCSNIARTFLVNPSEQIQSIYNLLISVEERILTDLKDGAKLNDVYKSAVSLVKKENSELVDKLTKNFGFAMGIEFREASLSIAPNCDAVAKKGKKIVQKSLIFVPKKQRIHLLSNSIPDFWRENSNSSKVQIKTKYAS